MRWKSVAFLVTVVASVASGQVNSIDRDINNNNPTTTKTTQRPTTKDTITSTAHDQHEVPMNKEYDEVIEGEIQSSVEDNGNEDPGLVPEESNPINSEPTSDEVDSTTPQPEGNGSDTTSTAEDTQEIELGTGESDSNENTTPSSEIGGGATETEESKSNSRSSEIVDIEMIEPIETEGGEVRGYYLHGESGIRSYIDIPYGQFSGLYQAPTEAAAWEDVLENKVHEKLCPQITEGGEYAGDVNCLSLSVFTPGEVENAAVFFHIYDGDFKVGSANPTIYGPEYLVPKGVILVLPNYRLGALGFLCLNNEIAPGNAGLKDLSLALEWVYNNIANFGGDPSKIFVSGDGSSGALAGYLALSPTSRQYVSGVITESGSVLAHWAIDRNSNITAASLADALQREITNDIDTEVLVTAAKDINFRPCVESGNNAFMNETPWEILNNEDNKIAIPFIIGSASHAGLQEALAHTSESISELNENFQKSLPNDLKFEKDEENEVSEKIKKQYFGDDNIVLGNMEQISLYYTDAYWLGPTIRASRALVRAGAKVYVYEFSFVGEINRMREALSTRQVVKGAARGDIVSYIFAQDGDVPSTDTDEERMVDLLTDLWISFLTSGKPSVEGVTWNVLSVDATEAEEEWLSIDHTTEQKEGLHVNRLALWTEVYTKHFIENLAFGIQSSMALIVTGLLLLCLQK